MRQATQVEWNEWRQKAHRLNTAWLVMVFVGVAVIPQAFPFQQELNGYLHFWNDNPLRLALSVMGFILVVGGLVVNRRFFHYIRIRPCDEPAKENLTA
ncbi:MAG: hypothetical protein ABH822_01065 [Patescibacteria group bacterium]